GVRALRDVPRSGVLPERACGQRRDRWPSGCLLDRDDVAHGLPQAHRRSGPVLMMERSLALQGAVNCRDIGGYLTTDSRRVRWGRVLRSDSLSELSTADR